MEDDARTVPSAPSVDPGSRADPRADPTVRLRPPTPRVAVVIAAAVLIAIVLFAAGSAVRPFVVGLLLAYLLDPLVERFARVGLPRWLAVLLVYAITVAIVAVALSIAIPPLVQQIASFTTELPDIVKLIQYQINHLNELYDRIGLPPELRTVADSIVASAVEAVQNLDIGFLQPIIGSAASFVTSIFGYLILPAWLFFLLKDRPKLLAAVDRSLPEPWRRDTWAIAGIVHEVFGKWIRGQLILGGVVGLASFIGLTILGLTVDPIFGRFAVLLAIIAALGELIPIIGPIISAVPAVLLGLTAGGGAALAALLLYLAIQQIENNVLVPKIQSDAIDLHPSLIITALIIGGAIFGLLGAILALPVTAAFRDVFKYVFRRASGASATGETGGATGDPDRPETADDVAAMEAAGAQFADDVGAEAVQ
ncbi:MAG: AI-2E family transporter [Chloroflexota bacterium]|nr:AI-2E family transporter [Chloroflexota bacterium]